MKPLFAALALCAVLVLPLLGAADTASAAQEPVVASALGSTLSWQEEDHFTGSDGPTNDIVPGTIWSLVGVVIGGLLLSVFYLLKRRVGGFPRNPAWVAPITIMPSRENADEGDFGDAPAAAHH